MLAVFCSLPGRAVSVKMTGPLVEVTKERERFIAFCASGFFAGVAGGLFLDLCAKEILRTRDTLNELWAKHTGQDVERIKEDTERDYFMAPEHAAEYGIIDEVIAHKKADAAE